MSRRSEGPGSDAGGRASRHRAAFVWALGIALAMVAGCTPPQAEQEPPSSAPPTAQPTAGTAEPSPGAAFDSLGRAEELFGGLVLQALGNEPFWSVEIAREAIVYRDPEHLEGIRFPYAAPRRMGEVVVFQATRPAPAPRSIRVEVTERTCSDGMSDLTYRYTSDVRMDSLELKGCARFRPPSPARR